jgi:hypothetical protein
MWPVSSNTSTGRTETQTNDQSDRPGYYTVIYCDPETGPDQDDGYDDHDDPDNFRQEIDDNWPM